MEIKAFPGGSRISKLHIGNTSVSKNEKTETKAKEENLAGEGQWAHRLEDARSTYAAMTLHTVDLLEFEGRISSQVASEIRAAVREMGEK